MEPLPSRETLLDLNQSNPEAGRQRSSGLLVPVLIFVFAIFVGTTYGTYDVWTKRPNESASLNRQPIWSLETPTRASDRGFVRVQDTPFWTKRAHGLITAKALIATQNASALLRQSNSKSNSKSIVELAPQSLANFETSQIEIVTGFAQVTGPVQIKTGDGHIRQLSVNETVVASSLKILPTMEPLVGSIHDLQNSGRISFSWGAVLSNDSNSPRALEFSRDPSFNAILFTQDVSAKKSAAVDFVDRSTGPWFARLVSENQTLAMTSFNLVESQTPDQLRRLGRRWFTWRDRGLAAIYRVEFAENETFQKITESFQVRNRELDLSLVPKGKYFVRVVALTVTDAEFSSRPISIDVPDKSEILHATLEINDPELKLQARAWKILLTHDEVSRIREGYVILRESELRGIKNPNPTQKNVVFELSRDDSFSNPERVRPDAHGELLPPALPLGALYARLRQIETDGTLGAFGPASRLTTWLPAPLTPTPKSSIIQGENGVELKWQLRTAVAGFELRLSTSKEFTPETTKAIRTRATSRRIVAKGLTHFFWTITALNELGQPISMTSDIQEVNDLKPRVEKLKTRVSKTDPNRVPAMIIPNSPVPQSPDEDAVIVGGATATKYGKLIWSFPAKKPGDRFEVQISTDGDFVNIIEKAKTEKQEFVLQGDLPEGALFWRVKKAKSKEWSRSRRFELIYE